jgi:hypothetical chaperone protein
VLRLVDDSLGFQVFEAIEATKCALSSEAEARFEFEYPGIEITETVTRPQFETGARPYVDRILGALDETLRLGGLSAENVDRVCLTGGTAKLPAIAERLESRFGHGKLYELSSFHSVIQGLAEGAHAAARE